MVKKISQHVDTLKFHYYINHSISDDSFHGYSKIVDSFISLKKEAQDLKNEYGDTKSINYTVGNIKFNVMPTSISGFSVVVYNSDISIAFRKSRSKVNPSPVLKVEFRAEFLARKGYKKAVSIVNNFVKEYLIDDSKVIISEIHLATDIQGYNFTHLDFFRVKSRSRKRETFQEETNEAKASAYGGITTFTGFALGGGDYHMRIYNKTKEIEKFKSKGFAKSLLWDLKSNYDPDKVVWRIEIQIRRSKLKRLTNEDNLNLDNYEAVMLNIPSLWNRALSDFTVRDISDVDTFNMLRGYRTLKNGKDRILTKNAIYNIFKRSDNLPFWADLKVWNTYIGSPLTTAFTVPQIGSSVYVANSIKSLFSTMGKHYGSVDSQTLVKAFKEANQTNLDEKSISLLEGSFNKQLDYFEKIDYMIDNGVKNVPAYKHLEDNIFTTILKASDSLYESGFSPTIVNRMLDRFVYTESEAENAF